ncbi:MAG: FHA domain-containing protein [Candidatus Accumulibacter sp.]|jgi:hypothetical protein|nr:FHA domain-containing protein [Accumulibacter sp.]
MLAAGICGNAHLHEKLGSSETSQAIDRCLKRIQRSVEAGGGRIVQIGGGEAMAAFDAADALVNAAIEMQQRIADLPPVSGVKMAIRVGISCDGGVSQGHKSENELAEEAALLAGVAKSGQILAIGRIRQALPESMRTLAGDAGTTFPAEAEDKEPIVEIVLEAPAESTQESAQDAAGSMSGCLRLHYGGNTLVLDEHKPLIDMGRDKTSDVIIRDPRASRHHATIERHGTLVVLIDRSTNGTYVTIDSDAELFVKHGKCALRGHGVIVFAASSSDADADCAQFECA